MAKGNALRFFGACLLLSWGAHACGGTVVDRNSPRERLTKYGAATCETTCKTVAACPKRTCSCGCDCPAGTPDCCDSVCMCKPPNVQECVKECQNLVDTELGRTGCESELLAVLDCAASGDCTPNQCVPVAQKYTNCRSSAPSSSGPVTCTSASTSRGGLTGPGEPADVGTIACDDELTECSDKHAYRLTCTVRSSEEISCECSIDGQSAGSFAATSCDVAMVQATEFCGWPHS